MLPQNLRTNIHEIDYEHNELFVFLEGFKRYCFVAESIPQSKRDTLLQMLATHFETEESFAKTAGIEFSHHERAHINMLDVVLKSLNQMSVNNSDLYSLIRYINYWFEKHILTFDLSLAKNVT
jgi:hemerythrin-like metal-binding protein